MDKLQTTRCLFGIIVTMGYSSCAIVMTTKTEIVYERGEPVGKPYAEHVKFPADYRIQKTGEHDALFVRIEGQEFDVEFHGQKFQTRRITKNSRKRGYGGMREIGIWGVKNVDPDLGLAGYCTINTCLLVPTLGFSGIAAFVDLVTLPFRTLDTEKAYIESVDVEQIPRKTQIENVHAVLDCEGVRIPFERNRAQISFSVLLGRAKGWQSVYQCAIDVDGDSPIRFSLNLAAYREQSPAIQSYILRNQKQILQTLLQMVNEYPPPPESAYSDTVNRWQLQMAIRDQAHFLDSSKGTRAKIIQISDDFSGNFSYKEREIRRRSLKETLEKALQEEILQ